jgi:bifunctional DNA-binding transcriptional regulator/antitoxin component of YhaV-PrlF toxin-antitoxin module
MSIEVKDPLPKRMEFGFTNVKAIGANKNTYATTIPIEIRDAFDIQIDDRVQWIIDFNAGTIELKIWPSTKEILKLKKTQKNLILQSKSLRYDLPDSTEK